MLSGNSGRGNTLPAQSTFRSLPGIQETAQNAEKQLVGVGARLSGTATVPVVC